MCFLRLSNVYFSCERGCKKIIFKKKTRPKNNWRHFLSHLFIFVHLGPNQADRLIHSGSFWPYQSWQKKKKIKLYDPSASGTVFQ